MEVWRLHKTKRKSVWRPRDCKCWHREQNNKLQEEQWVNQHPWKQKVESASVEAEGWSMLQAETLHQESAKCLISLWLDVGMLVKRLIVKLV